MHRERADDRHALLLAAREPVGVLGALVRRARSAEQPVGLLDRAGLELPSALRGPSVTFSSTVMCGNRLNAWKTIPIPRRTRFSRRPAR